MTPVVDIVSSIVTAMKPTMSVTIVGNSASPYVISGFTVVQINVLSVGEKLKIVGTNPVVTGYATITAIGTDNITVSTTSTLTTGKTDNAATVTPVINFHYGHRLEIVNRFMEITKNNSHKVSMFPALCLFTDITEKIGNNGFEREAELNIVIMTDTKPTFSAPERKTATFDPILQPLYDLFMDRLRISKYILEVVPDHNKIDRYFWGKNGLYGNTGNIFNDFIDAIEIDNLKIKTFKTC